MIKRKQQYVLIYKNQVIAESGSRRALELTRDAHIDTVKSSKSDYQIAKKG